MVLGQRRSSSSSHRLPGTSRKLSGSSRSRTAASPRSSASSARRFCSPPEQVETRRSRTSSKVSPRTLVVTVSQRTSTSYPPTSAQSLIAWAYATAAAVSSGLAWCSASARASRWPVARTMAGAKESSSWPTVVSSRIEPTSCGMTARVPSSATAPSAPWRSPPMIRSKVVLPTPLAPTRATWSPSPTRNDTSSNRVAPPGRVQRRWLTWSEPTVPTVGERPASRGRIQERDQRSGNKAWSRAAPGGSSSARPGNGGEVVQVRGAWVMSSPRKRTDSTRRAVRALHAAGGVQREHVEEHRVAGLERPADDRGTAGSAVDVGQLGQRSLREPLGLVVEERARHVPRRRGVSRRRTRA